MLEMLFGSGVRVKGQEECEHRGSMAVQDSISGPEPEKLKVARLDKAGMCAGRFEQNFIAEVYAPGK
jgi:hypothetical protein